MARKPDDTGGVISVAPNFAFDHAARRGLPKEGEPPLDLSQRQGDPQRQRADLRGLDAQVQRGIRAVRLPADRRSSRPTGWPRRRCSCRPPTCDEPPKIVYVDRDELNNGTLRRGARATRRTPSRRRLRARSASPSGRSSSTPRRPPNCPTGRSARSGSAARTWAPATGASRRDGRDLPEHPQVADQPVARRRRTDDATWVRTGDYGAFHDGELYITGRSRIW